MFAASDHIHQYQLKETKKQRAERESWGVSPSKGWLRIDIYYCIYCLDEQIRQQHAPLYEYPDSPPAWW
jgi:hypothetical protein